MNVVGLTEIALTENLFGDHLALTFGVGNYSK